MCLPKLTEAFTNTAGYLMFATDGVLVVLVVGDSVLIAGSLSANWIVDSGATSHMCYDKNLFVTYKKLQKTENVTLGDGKSLSVIGRGTVSLVMKLPEPRKLLETLRCWRHCMCRTCLLVSLRCPNVVGLVKLVVSSLTTTTKSGSLFLLNCQISEQVNVSVNVSIEVWHRWEAVVVRGFEADWFL